MESEGHFLISATTPHLIRRRRRCYCRLKILSDWRELAVSFSTSLFSPSVLSSFPFFLFLFLSSPPQRPSPRSRSPRGAEVEVAGAQRKRWRGLRVLRAELSSRCRQRPQLRAYISEAGAGTLPPALPYALSGSSQARLPPPTGSILGRTRPSAWQITRDVWVVPRRRPPRPERSASRDAGVQSLESSLLQGPELAEWAGLGASWRALALARRPGTRQRPPVLPGSGRKRSRFLRHI